MSENNRLIASTYIDKPSTGGKERLINEEQVHGYMLRLQACCTARKEEQQETQAAVAKEKRVVETALIQGLDPIIQRTARIFEKAYKELFARYQITLSHEDLVQELRRYIIDGDEFSRSYDLTKGSPTNFFIVVFQRRLRRVFLNTLKKKEGGKRVFRGESIYSIDEAYEKNFDEGVGVYNEEKQDDAASAVLERIARRKDAARLFNKITNPLDALTLVLRYGLGEDAVEYCLEQLRKIKMEQVSSEEVEGIIERVGYVDSSEFDKEHTEPWVAGILGVNRSRVGQRMKAALQQMQDASKK